MVVYKQVINLICLFTMKLRRPWTPEILIECYGVERKKDNWAWENYKLQTAMIIWFVVDTKCIPVH